MRRVRSALNPIFYLMRTLMYQNNSSSCGRNWRAVPLLPLSCLEGRCDHIYKEPFWSWAEPTNTLTNFQKTENYHTTNSSFPLRLQKPWRDDLIICTAQKWQSFVPAIGKAPFLFQSSVSFQSPSRKFGQILRLCSSQFSLSWPMSTELRGGEVITSWHRGLLCSHPEMRISDKLLRGNKPQATHQNSDVSHVKLHDLETSPRP